MLDTNILGILSPYVIAFGLAYIVSEGAKIVGIILKNKELRWHEFFKSGGMPSSHSANVMALATTIGLINGFDSAVFGLAIGYAAIVMYDAMHVRRATGEQGQVIRKLIERDANLENDIREALGKKVVNKIKTPYYSRGHKPEEVFVGCLIGIIVGFVVSLVWSSM